MNVGVGTLATAKRPANVSLKPLMRYYADGRREEFALGSEVRDRRRPCCRWAAR